MRPSAPLRVTVSTDYWL